MIRDDKRTKRQNGKGFYLLTDLGKGSSKVGGIGQIQKQTQTQKTQIQIW